LAVVAVVGVDCDNERVQREATRDIRDTGGPIPSDDTGAPCPPDDSSTVTINRDAYGVPHIIGSNDKAAPALTRSVLPPGSAEPGSDGDIAAQAELWMDGALKPAPLGQAAIEAIAVTSVTFALTD
jgi:acyl-homoserine lactone acylase PvdQ